MLRVYNTLTRKLEAFSPMIPGEVKMYGCGITVYAGAHIGHARQAVVYDLFRRYLEFLGFRVTYVRNFTDIDDKIIAKANTLGRPALEVSSHYIDETERELATLKVQPATVQPKVSEHIQEIIQFIEVLYEKGFAYVAGGDILFDVSAKSDYGKLSGRNLTECLNSDDNPLKRNPQDFALWKAAKAGEPFWDSPWGPGRPGWHIECSAMARKYLGDTFDIHGGGIDLVFPHHENEIAQSEAYSGLPLARYWIHNGLVNLDGKKMSKSLGNIYELSSALADHHRDVIRFAILAARYNSPIDFTPDLFRNMTKRVYWFYRSLARVDQTLATVTPEQKIFETSMSSFGSEMEAEFTEAMNDDFNSAKAIALLIKRVTKINEVVTAKQLSAEQIQQLVTFRRAFSRIAEVLGTFDEDAQSTVDWFKASFLRNTDLQEEEIDRLIAARNEAKKVRNFALADQIRANLQTKGVTLQDGASETTWDLAL